MLGGALLVEFKSARRCGCTSCCGVYSRRCSRSYCCACIKGDADRAAVQAQGRAKAACGPTEIEREPMCSTSCDRPELVWPTLRHSPALAVLLGLGTLADERKALEGRPARQDRGARRRRTASGRARRRSHAQRRATSNTCTCPRLAASTTTRSAISMRQQPPASAGTSTRRWKSLRPAWSGSTAGFVPDASKAPAARAAGQVPGEVEVRGLVRVPRAKTHVHARRTMSQRNLWYWPDIPGHDGIGLPGQSPLSPLCRSRSTLMPSPHHRAACPRAASRGSPCPTGIWNMRSPGTAWP